MKGWKKIFHANGDLKKEGVVILISDKIDFDINTIIRDRSTSHNDQMINLRKRTIINISVPTEEHLNT